MSGGEEQAARPLLRVVRGEPTPEQLAALVAVLTARSAAAAAAADTATAPRTAWNAPVRLVRQPVHVGPGGWRASALPR